MDGEGGDKKFLVFRRLNFSASKNHQLKTHSVSRVIRSPEKQIRYKKKRRVLSALLFLALAGFMGLVIRVPSIEALQIKSIIVKGNKVLTKEEVGKFAETALSGKYFHAFPKTNIFLYPKKTVEKGLFRAFPRIASVSADLDTERIFTISLTEREPFALWCGKEMAEVSSEDGCYYLDDKGFVFANAPHFSGNAYFEFYGKGILPDTDPPGHDFLPAVSYRRILKIKERLESFGVNPVKIAVLDDGSAEFTEKSGYRVRFNIDEDISSLESNMQAVFHSSSWGDAVRSGSLEYLDFRFGNKVYYKYKSQK
jgi:hypothetical protein